MKMNFLNYFSFHYLLLEQVKFLNQLPLKLQLKKSEIYLDT